MKAKELIRSLWAYIKLDKWMFILFVIVSFVRTLSALLYGFLFGLSVNYLVQHNFNQFLVAIILYGVYCLVDTGLLMFYKNYLYIKLENNFMRRISKDLYQKALDLPVKAYDEHKVGEVVNRIYTDPNKVIELLDRIVLAMANVLTVMVIIGASLTVSWILTLEFVIIIIINYLFSRKYYPKLKDVQEKISKSADKYVADANQVLMGIRDVKGLGLIGTMNNYMKDNVDNLTDETVKSRKFEMYYNTTIDVLLSIFEVVVFITLGYLVYQGQVSMTIFVAFQWYIWKLFDVSREVTRLGVSYQRVKVAMTRINEVLNNKLYEDDKFGSQEVKETVGNIEFNKVCFGYGEDKAVLNELSMKIPTGKKIAIVGKSGMGKSTIFNMLLRFYEPSNGEILIDEINIKDFDQESLRKHIAIIRQEPYIFNQTIKENFEIIKADITMDEIRELCKKVYIDDYIMSLKDGYETLIGEGGINLSGGQKQRLAIARSLSKNSKIMMFDESTSALDNESQAWIKKTIDDLAKDHTIIIVAHRLSTIEDADIIFLIDDGKVVAEGNHEELLRTNELYQRLYQPEMLELNI